MDIVIPLGSGSQWQDNELRFSLRSLEQYCEDPGQIYIIGEKPTWLINVIHIPFRETEKKQINIWKKTYAACQDPRISEEFFFCNDDFFFLKSFSCNNYPFYHKGDIASKGYIKPEVVTHPYFKIVKNTMLLLQSHGFATWDFDIHRPMIISKSRFIEMYNFFEQEVISGREHIMKSSYCNFNQITGQESFDIKIKRKDQLVLAEILKDADMFSVFNAVSRVVLMKYLSRLFPNKSKYEC